MLLVPALLALLTLLLAACSSSADQPGAAQDTTGQSAPESSSTGGTDTSAEAIIVIADFSYQVPESVPAGASVTVWNEDEVGHTVTADEGGLFDVAVGPGEQVTFTAPAEPGEYPFHCIPHPHMTATLGVSDG